jgi:hypothetical protein
LRLPTGTCLSEFIDFRLDEIEWTPVTVTVLVPARVRRRYRWRANRRAKKFAAEWLKWAREQAERTAELVRRDAIDQIRRDELAAQSAELLDSAKIAERMAAAETRKPRKAMSKAIKRERQKLERAGKALARAKLAAFRKRNS